MVTAGVSPYPAILHGYAASGHWEDATKLCRSLLTSSSLSPIITTTITIKKTVSPNPFKYTIKGSVLCRFVKDPVLWACLAGLAVHSKHLDTAEVAYAAIQEADKVVF